MLVYNFLFKTVRVIMGFFDVVADVVKDIAKETYRGVKKNTEEYAELKKSFKSRSDDELITIYKSGSTNEKLAAFNVLKSKGYDAEQLKQL